MSNANEWTVETSRPLKKKGEAPTMGASAKFDPWIVYSKWELINHRPEPTSIEFTRHDGRAITASQLRAIPLGEIVSRWRHALPVSVNVIRRQGPIPGFDLSPEAYEPFASTGPQRGQRLSREELEKVAAVYRQAWRDGMPVQEAVRTACNVAPSTATKRIMAARKAGLLEGVGPK